MPYKEHEVRKSYWRKYSKLNREKKSENGYRSNLRLKFGMTLEQYNEILMRQNFSCAICCRHVSQFNRRLCVDHDHDTGRIRGLLCTHCNVILAQLGDNKESVQRVLDYLNDVDSGI